MYSKWNLYGVDIHKNVEELKGFHESQTKGLILSFHRVLYVACFLLGNSLATEF